MSEGVSATIRRVAGSPARLVVLTALALGLALAAVQHAVEDLLTLESPSEEALLDRLFHGRDQAVAPPGEEVLLVHFDAETFKVLDTPWQDFAPQLAKLIELLRSGEPRVIGLDLGFSFLQQTDKEEALLASCEQRDDVVFTSEVEEATPVAPLSRGVVAMVKRAHPPLGFANLTLGDDPAIMRANRGHVVRLAPLEAKLAGGAVRRSFPLELARRARRKDAASLTVSDRELVLGDRRLPLEHGCLRIDYPGPRYFTSIGAEKLLTGKIPPRIVKDRLVIVGSAYQPLGDTHRTPQGMAHGMRIQAAIAYTLLEGRPPRRAPGPLGPLAVLVISGAIGALFSRLTRGKALGASLALAPLVYVAALQAFQWGVWLPCGFALLAVPVTSFALWGVDLMRTPQVVRVGGVVRGTAGASAGPVEVTQAAGTAGSFDDGGDLVLRVAREVISDRYQGATLLGRGGMGVVLKAFDPQRGQHVAVKILSPLLTDRPQLVTRFMREIKALQGLEHPGVVRIFDVGDQGSSPYYSMEMVDGADLKTAMREGPFSLEKARDVFEQLLDVLAHIHVHGVIHRDIKPENVLLTPSGKVKLLDFGLAHLPEASALTQDGEVMGTLRYMSPEQMEGVELSCASDVFSIGLVIYEALSGRMPFPEIGRVLHHSGTITSLAAVRPDAPIALAELLMDCVSPAAKFRPADCGAVLARWRALWK